MSNADKSKMENATIWVVQPKSHKVGELFHRYPFSAKEKNMRQVDHGRLCIRQLSFVCSLMFLILAVMFFKQTFWRRRILGYANMNTEFLCCIYVLRM